MSHLCRFAKAVTEINGSDFGEQGCSTAGRESLCKSCSGTFIYSCCWPHCPQDAVTIAMALVEGSLLGTDQTVAADGSSRGDYPDTVDGECIRESTFPAQADGNPWH